MKLYNNSQKLHRVNHYTKWNEIVKHLIKNEGIHSNITVGSPLGRAVWQEKHPEQFYKITEKIYTHKKYSSRQLIYTKATRISLQHQILILYTAFSWKVVFRRRSVVRLYAYTVLSDRAFLLLLFLFFKLSGAVVRAVCVLW